MLKANKVLISWQDVVFIKWVLLKCQLQRFVYLLSFLSQGLRIHVFNILFSRNKEEQKEEDGLTWDHHNSNSESKWLHLREQGFSVGTRDTLDMWFLKIKKEMWSKGWEENSNEQLTRKEKKRRKGMKQNEARNELHRSTCEVVSEKRQHPCHGPVTETRDSGEKIAN